MKTVMTGIVDTDVHGTTGIGTIFYMEVREKDVLIVRHEWGLLEQITGKFDLRAVAAPYHAENKLAMDAEKKQQNEEKKAEKQSRVDGVEDNPKLIALINEVIAANPKIVQQIIAGKDKASNALVGQIIGKIRSLGGGFATDAMSISVLLKKCLSVTN